MKYIATVLVLVSLLGVSYCQPTITASQVVQLLTAGDGVNGGDNYSSTAATGIDALIAISGPNQSWNFNAVTFSKDASSTGTFKEATGFEPLATSFPLATHVEIDMGMTINQYNYYMINDTGMMLLGAVDDTVGGGKGITEVDNPPMQLFKFPLTYQTAWTTTITDPTLGALTMNCIVDSWGTLILPGQSEATCLRIKRSATISGFTYAQYQWLGTNGLRADATAGILTQPSSASYHVPTGSSDVKAASAESVIAIANPITASTMLDLTLPQAGTTKIALTDILGRNCLTLFDGNASTTTMHLPVNISSLTNGTYFLSIESPKLHTIRKITVAH